MCLIDNSSVKLLDVIREILQDAETAKIATGYFYISGFELLEEELSHVKEIRVLMGPETGISTAEALLAGVGKPAILERMETELKQSEFSSEAVQRVGLVHDLLKSGRMSVRVIAGRRFHSKAYIFKRQNGDLAIVGSSNMTRSGLTDNIELNLTVKDRGTVQALESWFDELWNTAEDLSIQLLQSIEVSKVYEYIQTGLPACLYLAPLDFFKTLIKTLDREYLLTEEGLLLPFQELDYKISKETISQYGGVIVSSSVGLGKSYVACRIIKDYYSQGKRVLLVIPPNLREQWEGYLRLFDIPPSRVAIVSMFELSKSDFDRDRYRGFDLIIVDESHNFRNSASNRTRHFMKSVKNSRAAYILLSATPINNSLADLLTQVDMFMVPERFKAAGIQGLYSDLVGYVRSGDPSLKSAIVQLRSKLLVQTTRKMLQQMYKEVVLPGKGVVKFREPDLDTKSYELSGPVYKEIFRKIVNFLSTLELPHLRILNPEGGRVLVGLYTILLYKRLESSIYAFYESVLAIERRERKLRELLQEYSPAEVRSLGEESLRTFLAGLDDAQMTMLEIDPNAPDDWERSVYLDHIAHDLKHVGEFRRLIENLIQTRTRSKIEFSDDKLDLLRSIVRRNIDRKILLFTQFKDTAVYLYQNLQDMISDDFSIRVVTGDTKDKILEVMRFSPSSQQDIIARSCKLDGQRTDFLITTDALSEGVNMQEADIVINYDLPWNPVRIIQRVGRVDRIGSNKRSKVINFIPSKSIDKGLGLLKILNDKIDNIIEILGIEHSILSIEEREKIRGQEGKLLKAIQEKVEAQRKLQLEKLEVQYEGRRIGELDKYLMSQMLEHQVRMNDLVDARVPDRPFYTVLKDRQHRLMFLYEINDGLTTRYESVLLENGTWTRERVPSIEELVSPREELVDRDLDCIRAFDTEYLREEVNLAKAAQHEALDPDTNKVKLDIVTRLQSYVYGMSLTGDDEALRERIAPLLSRFEAVSVPRTAKADLMRLRRDWMSSHRYLEEGTAFLEDLECLLAGIEQSSTQTIHASDIRGELRAFVVYDHE